MTFPILLRCGSQPKSNFIRSISRQDRYTLPSARAGDNEVEICYASALFHIDETGLSAHFEKIVLRISYTAPPTRPPISSPKAPLAIFCDLLVFQAKSAYGTKNRTVLATHPDIAFPIARITMKNMNAYKGIDQRSARSAKRSLRRKKLTPTNAKKQDRIQIVTR